MVIVGAQPAVEVLHRVDRRPADVGDRFGAGIHAPIGRNACGVGARRDVGNLSHSDAGCPQMTDTAGGPVSVVVRSRRTLGDVDSDRSGGDACVVVDSQARSVHYCVVDHGAVAGLFDLHAGPGNQAGNGEILIIRDFPLPVVELKGTDVDNVVGIS